MVVPIVRRPESPVALCATDVGHDAFQYGVAGVAGVVVVDGVHQRVVPEVGVHTSVDRPVGVDLSSEFGTEKCRRESVELPSCQLDVMGWSSRAGLAVRPGPGAG